MQWRSREWLGNGRARSAGRVVSRRILNHGPDMQRRLHPKVEASYAPGTKASTPALSRRIPLGCEASPATTAAFGFYLAGGSGGRSSAIRLDPADGEAVGFGTDPGCVLRMP